MERKLFQTEGAKGADVEHTVCTQGSRSWLEIGCVSQGRGRNIWASTLRLHCIVEATNPRHRHLHLNAKAVRSHSAME